MPDIFVSSDRVKKEKKKGSGKRKKDLKNKNLTHELEGHSHNPLSSFCYYPDNVNFETREKKEKIVLLLRRHFITNTRWIFVGILMIIAPVVLTSFPLLSFLPANFKLIAILGWYLVTIAFVLEGFLSWFFNVNIVTDERIVDIDFHNLIYKEVSDTKIDKIQDVTYRMGGVIRTIFNYGDVDIQTAAEKTEFDFSAVPKPDRVARVLQDLIIEEEQEKLEGRVR